MFRNATEFNGDVSDWDVSSVIDMIVSFHFSFYVLLKKPNILSTYNSCLILIIFIQ